MERPANWPLVGRDAELRVAREACGAGHGVVLAGAAGVGKTRLAAELVDVLAADATPVVRLVATRSAASIPFGAFGPLVPPDATLDVLTINGVADAVRARHADGAPILFVDDAHLLDEASAALLHRLVLDRIVLAVVTVRSGEPAPDPVVALWKDGSCERLELQVLSVTEVARLVERVLGPVDEAVPQRLWRTSRGNPLWLRELVKAAIDHGALQERRGVWVWAGPLRVAPALADLLSAHVDELDTTARDTLALVALGEPLALDVLTGIGRAEPLEVLVREHLVETAGDTPFVHLAHPLYGEIVRTELTGPAQVRLSRELALAHPKHLADPGAELRRVVWHLDGGVADDPELLLQASRVAQVHKLALATRLARAAVDAGGGVTARLRLADLLANGGRVEEADAVLAEIDDAELDDPSRIRVASVRATTLLWFLKRPGDARRVIEDAEAALDDPSLASELLATRVQAALQEGEVDEVGRLVVRVLDDPEASLDVRAGVLVAAVPAWLLAGDLETAIVRCRAALDLAARTTNAFPVGDVLEFGIATARLYLGELDVADERFRELRSAAAASESDVALRFMFSQGLGRLEMVRGRASQAERFFSEAAAMVRLSPDLVAWNLALLAQAQAAAGHVDAAAATLTSAGAAPPSAMVVPDIGRAEALLADARGERSRAIEHALEVADAALAQHQRLNVMLCAHDAGRWGAAADALARIDAAVDGFPGRLAPALRDHVAALASGDPVALEDASTALEACGALADAAEAAASAAAAFWRDGLRARATRQAERASALAAGTEIELADLTTLQSVSLLTPREREVASLAGRGRSDKEIADALGVSVRTVETHLHRAYAKLGVEGRWGLADALGEPPAPA